MDEGIPKFNRDSLYYRGWLVKALFYFLLNEIKMKLKFR